MQNTQKVRAMLAQIGGACVQITLGCGDCQERPFDVDVLVELENALLELYKNARTLRHSASSTIDPALDHDELTEPGGGWPDEVDALKRAGARFEILLRWGGTQSGMPIDHVGWHTGENRFKWRGTFEEARQIVREKYGPKRGTEARIVVVVDQ
jgi:hypothetical protein